ncbi:protein-disulfide isomerase [Pseudomonas aeruginosa]|uniref:DsbA family protein n=1 Tax=Pseudomonas aeruginosa TaxID=287 RepID=UPI000EF24D18|nr:DsbA family protein [Pseudomonas aeruginosa]AYL28563.1 protein-disulfide isomerase [Pseudomonas aeruginosa]
MRLWKSGWAAKRFQGPAQPWAGLLLVLLAVSALGVELLVKGLPANHPANHRLYGDAKARWTINEYADLECPFCKAYTPRLQRWVDSHPEVNLIWRHLPLQMHGEAAHYQARLAECAGIQGGAIAFWSAIDAIFTQSVGNGGGLAAGILRLPELDRFQLEVCAKDNELVDLRIQHSITTAQSQGITATPTLVIQDNQTGRSVKLEGMADETTLLSAIDWLAKDL